MTLFVGKYADFFAVSTNVDGRCLKGNYSILQYVEFRIHPIRADALFQQKKKPKEMISYGFPYFGGKVEVPLVSLDEREQFILDITRKGVDLRKFSYQNRARKVIVLARLDINGRAHRNPDGNKIGCPHLHLYREGFNDKWAFPVPGEHFTNFDDPWIILEEFQKFCNVVKSPVFHFGICT